MFCNPFFDLGSEDYTASHCCGGCEFEFNHEAIWLYLANGIRLCRSVPSSRMNILGPLRIRYDPCKVRLHQAGNGQLPEECGRLDSLRRTYHSGGFILSRALLLPIEIGR